MQSSFFVFFFFGVVCPHHKKKKRVAHTGCFPFFSPKPNTEDKIRVGLRGESHRATAFFLFFLIL